jgi:hypothetical protein
MSDEQNGDAQSPAPYEPPKLTLVGNLNDLLAGTGSRDTDLHIACTSGTEADPDLC